MIVWLDEGALQTIRQETSKYPTLETGGALFGWRDINQYVIAYAGDPGPRAQHREYSFEADRGHSQSLIDRLHEKSQGRYRFIGSWHSHPGNNRDPSERDRKTASDIAADRKVNLAEPLILIISQRASALPNEDPDTRVSCYSWSQPEQQLVRTQLLSTNVVNALVGQNCDFTPRPINPQEKRKPLT